MVTYADERFFEIRDDVSSSGIMKQMSNQTREEEEEERLQCESKRIRGMI